MYTARQQAPHARCHSSRIRIGRKRAKRTRRKFKERKAVFQANADAGRSEEAERGGTPEGRAEEEIERKEEEGVEGKEGERESVEEDYGGEGEAGRESEKEGNS